MAQIPPLLKQRGLELNDPSSYWICSLVYMLPSTSLPLSIAYIMQHWSTDCGTHMASLEWHWTGWNPTWARVNRTSSEDHVIPITSSSTPVFLKVQHWDPSYSPCTSHHWLDSFGRLKYAIISMLMIPRCISRCQEIIQVYNETLERCVSKVHEWLLHNGLALNPANPTLSSFRSVAAVHVLTVLQWSMYRAPTSSQQQPSRALESCWINTYRSINK